MSKYRITNKASGADLGVYEAPDPSTARDRMARDAGYEDYADMLRVIEGKPDEILIEEEPMITATICHNDDDYKDPAHRRITLTLEPRNGRFVWMAPDGPTHADGSTEEEAVEGLKQVYCDPAWALELGEEAKAIWER